MAVTQSQYTGNGSTVLYNFTFPYLNATDVKVKLNGVTQATTEYSFANATTIQMNTAPANGAAVIIFRDTDNDNKKATFYPGSAIKAEDLNDNIDQILYVAQEVDNNAMSTIGDDAMQGNLDLGNNKIVNLANPTSGTDGVNKTTLDSSIDTAIDNDVLAGTDLAKTASGGQVTINHSVTGANTTINNSNGSVVQDIEISAQGHVLSAGSTDLDARYYTETELDAGQLDNRYFTETELSGGQLNNLYYTETELDGGQLDNRYFTETELTSGGSLDTRYYTESELNGGQLDSRYFTETELTGGTLDTRYYTETELDAGQLDNRYYTETELTNGALDSRYFRQDSTETITSGAAWSNGDTHIATTAAINARILDLVDDVGGFIAITNETSFPTSNPDPQNGTGTIVSIQAASTALAPSGTTLTISNAAGTGNTVTVTGVSSTIPSGYGFLVETTSTLHTYTFHRLVPKATEVTTVANNATAVSNVSGSLSAVTTLNSNLTNVNSVATNIANVNSVASNISNVNSAVSNASNINSAVSNATNINQVASDTTPINTVATNIANVNAVAGNSYNVNQTGANSANIITVANNIANVNTTAGSISNVNTVASNITSVNNFAERYRVASSDPTSSLDSGDTYFNTTSNKFRVYDGTSWNDAVIGESNQNAFTTVAVSGQSDVIAESTTDTLTLAAGSNISLTTNAGSDTVTIASSGVSDGSVTTAKIADDAVTSAKIADDSINSEHYVDGSIDSAHIANGQITSAKIDTNAVANVNIASSAVTTDKIANDAVTGAKIADYAVGTSQINDTSVTTQKIASGAVTFVKLANDAVTTDKIANDAVTTDKLANSINTEIAANTAKVSNASHTGEVTGSGTLTIADNVVDEANLKISNSPTNGYVLTAQSGNTGGLTWAAQTDTNTTYSAGSGLTLSGTTFSANVSKSDVGLGNVENTALSTWGGSTYINTLGTVSTVTSTASGTAGVRKIYTSTSNPSGGADGDIWIKYT